MSKIELPALPPDRYSQTGDIKDANWLLLADVHARDRQIVELCASIAREFRRGAGDPVCAEVAAAIRSLLDPASPSSLPAEQQKGGA